MVTGLRLLALIGGHSQARNGTGLDWWYRAGRMRRGCHDPGHWSLRDFSPTGLAFLVGRVGSSFQFGSGGVQGLGEAGDLSLQADAVTVVPLEA